MSRTVQQLFDLTGQVALVTGGSRGLGLQIAQALGEAGAKIMLSARKADELEMAVAQLQAAGIDARWIAPIAAKKRICADWPTKPWNAWARSISWSTTQGPLGVRLQKTTRSRLGTRS